MLVLTMVEADYRSFLQKRYFLIMQYRIRRKEVVKENSFWNDADTAVDEHVNVVTDIYLKS